MESSGADNRKALRRALLGGDDDDRHEMEGLRRRHGEQVTIFVMTLTGDCIMLKVDLLDTFSSVKAMIENEEGMRFGRDYFLYLRGKYPQDDDTLASCGIQKESTLYIKRRLRGGAPPQVLRGTGSPAQQQKRYATYSRKVFLFVITMVVAYKVSPSKVSPSESLSVAKAAFMIGISAVIFADAALSLKKALAPKWPSALIYLSVPWSIYLSGFFLVLSLYLLFVSLNKYYGYAIIPVPLPMLAALVHHRLKSEVSQQQQTRMMTIDGGEADQAVDTERANEEVLRGENYGQADDEADVEHFDDIFENSCNYVTCGGLVTMLFTVGPVSLVGFLYFYTVVLGLYTMTITTVRTVALTPHATYLQIIMKALAGMTAIAYLFEYVR